MTIRTEGTQLQDPTSPAARAGCARVQIAAVSSAAVAPLAAGVLTAVPAEAGGAAGREGNTDRVQVTDPADDTSGVNGASIDVTLVQYSSTTNFHGLGPAVTVQTVFAQWIPFAGQATTTTFKAGTKTFVWEGGEFGSTLYKTINGKERLVGFR